MKHEKQSECEFHKKTLENLEVPPKGKIRRYDIKEKGLGLYVTATGHKSFSVKKRIHGQPKEIIIGPFPDIRVEQARRAAQKIKGDIARGKNPLEKKEKQASEKAIICEIIEKRVIIANKPAINCLTIGGEK
ncbi:MAG: Arm DNA-binding domain-containing protein, partial [Puniceicoccales bacterium]|nr:Arm DNA-binding domain-containing protein [Puniceicoccales bacterium]